MGTRVSCLFLFVFIFGLSTSNAEVHFISIKNEAWKQETLKTIAWLNSQLPANWPRPKKFKIAYVEKGSPAYHPVFRYSGQDGQMKFEEKILVVNDDAQAKFFHEYAHLVMDELFRKESLAWRYFLVWFKAQFSPLEATLVLYQEQIATLESALAEFQKRRTDGDDSEILKNVIANTKQSIQSFSSFVGDIAGVLNESKNLSYSLESFNSIEAILPYGELFADSFAVLLLENWQAMRDLTQKDLTEGDLANQIILPPSDSRQESISLYLEHRDFTTGVELESYVFQDWEADGPYTQFKPLRSKIRQLKSHGYSNTQLIRGLGEAILFVYEKGLVPNPHLLDQELYEKNKSMSTALDRALDTVNGVSPSQ